MAEPIEADTEADAWTQSSDGAPPSWWLTARRDVDDLPDALHTEVEPGAPPCEGQRDRSRLDLEPRTFVTP